MHRIIFLQPAKKDLHEIAAYYNELFGHGSAQKVIEIIKKAIMRLELFPESGSMPPDQLLAKQGYRMVIAGNFVAIYKLIHDNVYIYHICNTQTDYISLF